MQKLVLLVCAVSMYGCIDGLVCEEGTLEIDGFCRLPDIAVDPPKCGQGTHLEDTVCVPDLPPTVCDPDTTEAVVDVTGVTVCIGSVPPDCAGPIACPSPDAGKIAVCGRLIDLETRTRIAGDGSVVRCDPQNPEADGPCSLQIRFVDALAFVGNPMTPPLATDEIVIDQCGRFRGKNVTLPFNKAVGVAVEPIDGDTRVLTGVAFFGTSGERRTGVNAYSTMRSTDQMWTDTGAPPFAPQTFSENGVFVGLFMHNGAPVEGVRVTSGGATQPDDDYYFADQDEQLTTVGPALTSTGPNGAVLLVDSPLGEHSGVGGEVGNCTWESALGTSQIPGVVFVAERHLVDPLGDPCPE